MDRVEIDGQDGGGQVVRTALSLSVLTDVDVVIENVRGNRETPGLKPQHIAGIRALSRFTSGFVSGCYSESERVEYQPRTMPSGSMEHDIETAASIPLVFEIIAPVSPVARDEVSLTLIGGTDVKWSPTWAYYEGIRLAGLQDAGFDVEGTLARTGFYPKGGGHASLHLEPADPSPIERTERGELERLTVDSKASTDLADQDVAERQRDGLADTLESEGFTIDDATVASVDSDSTGSAICLTAEYEHTTVGFDALGEPGTLAEMVGGSAADGFLAFHDGTGAVDEHLADQLMLPVAIAGGTYTAPRVTEHMRTNAEAIRAFDVDIELEETADAVRVSAPGMDLA